VRPPEVEVEAARVLDRLGEVLLRQIRERRQPIANARFAAPGGESDESEARCVMHFTLYAKCIRDREPPMRSATSSIRTLRPRRTQAERRATTRQRILEAVVSSIAEVGFRQTTATRIAARAGVTWGAVQHHYGGKEGILAAVLDDTFTRFASHFDDLPDPATTPLDVRARQFVARAWAHFGGSHFRSMFEILLQAFRGSGEHRATPGEQQLRMLEGVDRLWRRAFPDAPLPRARRVELESYTLAVLMGLALQRAIAGGGTREPKVEIGLLARTLASELASAAASGRARGARPQRVRRPATTKTARRRRNAAAG